MARHRKCLLAAVFLITAVFFLPSHALASGLVDDTVNDAHGFSRYPIGHYALDLYIDPNAGSGWFGIQMPDVSRILFSITNAIWELCVFLASVVGSVVQEAFRLDFLSQATDEIGRNIQQIAGVSERGFSSTGFLPMLLPLAVLALGAYVLYVGLFKRETSKALGAVVNFLVIFVLIIGFIAFAPTYISAINAFSVELADGALRVANAILNPGAGDADMAVAGIREALHQVQVHGPWQLLQFGSLDVDPARVQALLAHGPHSDARLDAVIREVEVYGNPQLSGEVDRFGTVLILFFISLGISMFVLSLTGLMIFSQLLLIFHLTLLPIALVLSLFPTFSGIAKRSIGRVFNTLLLRVGYTLIITIAFSLALLVYRVSSDLSMPFLLVGFLQILVFWGVHKKQDELLGMLSLQSGENHRAERSVLQTGRNLGRRALAFGKGIVAGKIISGRRSQQGNNVAHSRNSGGTEQAAETQPNRAEAPPPIENRGGNSSVPQNVPGTPIRTDKPGKPDQPDRPVPIPPAPVGPTTLGGQIGHSIGKLVDAPAKWRDRAALAKEKVRDIPVHTRHTVAQNIQEFRANLSDAPEKGRDLRADQRTQYRNRVEVKRKKLHEGKAQKLSVRQPVPQRETPRASTAPRPQHVPAKSTATYKLNGVPVTKEQFGRMGEPPQKRRDKQSRRDKEWRP